MQADYINTAYQIAKNLNFPLNLALLDWLQNFDDTFGVTGNINTFENF